MLLWEKTMEPQNPIFLELIGGNEELVLMKWFIHNSSAG
jgi:hypothetical protein